jgi:hypothetical protein
VVNGRDDRLHVYLNDHLAGSAAAIQLASRRADEHEGTELGTHLRELVAEIETDRRTLERVMEAVGASPNRIKQGAAIGAELVTRLKHLVPVVGSGSRETALLEDLELLSLGIEGKRLLWLALASRAARDDRLAEFAFAELEERAARQRDGLERFRLEAAAAAFDG